MPGMLRAARTCWTWPGPGNLPGNLKESMASSGTPKKIRRYLQCEAPKIANLVNISPLTMVYGTQITIDTGANLKQLTTGGPHIVPYLPSGKHTKSY